MNATRKPTHREIAKPKNNKDDWPSQLPSLEGTFFMWEQSKAFRVLGPVEYLKNGTLCKIRIAYWDASGRPSDEEEEEPDQVVISLAHRRIHQGKPTWREETHIRTNASIFYGTLMFK